MAQVVVEAMTLVRGVIDVSEVFGKQATENSNREAFVRNLMHKLQYELDRHQKLCNFVIFDLAYPHDATGIVNTGNAYDYYSSHAFGTTFGIWIFEHGIFRNKSLQGAREVWAFGGYQGGKWEASGDPTKTSSSIFSEKGIGSILTFVKPQLMNKTVSEAEVSSANGETK